MPGDDAIEAALIRFGAAVGPKTDAEITRLRAANVALAAALRLCLDAMTRDGHYPHDVSDRACATLAAFADSMPVPAEAAGKPKKHAGG